MTNEKRILQDLVMTDTELSELVDKHMDSMTADVVSDAILDICQKCVQNEPTEWNNATRMEKMTYISQEMYRKGFIDALWLMNESIRVICSRT